VHSDHGFERLDKDVYVNYVLAENGFLRWDGGRDAGLESIRDGTTAFALDPGRIYLNRKGRYPRGTIDEMEAARLLAEIADVFGALEIDGRKVIRAVCRKEDIYSGPCLAYAPDLVLVAAEGFNLKGKPRAEMLAESSFFTGKHTQDTGFLLVRSPADEKAIPEQPTVCDIKSIVESQRAAVNH
jgi:predicted AlkP superfamily phosphohydrolase/phosphomutase